MNWKDREGGGSEARASREVGGRYWIHCQDAAFQIDYWPGFGLSWKTIYRTEFGTLAEAKQMAEKDHEQRRAQAAAGGR